MFKFNILIGNLLHSKYAFDYLIRLIFNLPTLQKTFLDLIIRCSRNDAHRCEILQTIIRLHPHQKYPLLRLCHQRQTLLPLIVDFLDCSTINMLVEILSNHQSCLWLKKSLHDELIEKILRKLFQIHYQDNRLIQSILKSIGILHVQCKVQWVSVSFHCSSTRQSSARILPIIFLETFLDTFYGTHISQHRQIHFNHRDSERERDWKLCVSSSRNVWSIDGFEDFHISSAKKNFV